MFPLWPCFQYPKLAKSVICHVYSVPRASFDVAAFSNLLLSSSSLEVGPRQHMLTEAFSLFFLFFLILSPNICCILSKYVPPPSLSFSFPLHAISHRSALRNENTSPVQTLTANMARVRDECRIFSLFVFGAPKHLGRHAHRCTNTAYIPSSDGLSSDGASTM